MKCLTIVRSSMLHAVGYDRETRTLEVVFNDGGIYLYQDVPRGVYAGLMASKSKGQYMQREVLPFYTALPLAVRGANR